MPSGDERRKFASGERTPLLAGKSDDLGKSFDSPSDERKSGEERLSYFSPNGSLCRFSGRPDHLNSLIGSKRESDRFVAIFLQEELRQEEVLAAEVSAAEEFNLTETEKQKIREDMAFMKRFDALVVELRKHFPWMFSQVEVRMMDFNYHVTVDSFKEKIKTVYNQSVVYHVWQWFLRVHRGEKLREPQTKCVLENINLVLKPGKMYLILGPPASGKTSLLKALAGRLSNSKTEKIEGSIEYNGLVLQAGNHVENVISYIDQLDFHSPRLTVFEAFDFAFQCKSGGTHVAKEDIKSQEDADLVQRLDETNTRVQSNLEVLSLTHVADTFVGNSEVRGVSGGQRRRVTIGEMLGSATPVLCGDEISTGLDAASTYEICFALMHFTRLVGMTRIISLLQPSPETVSLFDEVILLSEGRVIYAGPLEEVQAYFAFLGYICPANMDIADFLQVIATPDGASFWQPPENQKSDGSTPYSPQELALIFDSSRQKAQIVSSLSEPWNVKWDAEMVPMLRGVKTKYRNSADRMIWLNFKRLILIWLRDKRVLIANAIKNIIMGCSVGGVFFQTDSVASIYGVFFQTMLFIMLGSMVAIPEQVTDKIIYYKHFDANFYGSYSYAVGLGMSLVPQSLIDVSIFGTIIYWMVGLAPSASNFFIYLGILYLFSIVTNQMLGVFAAISRTKSEVQAYSSVVLLFQILFSGFIVLATVIPACYRWVYWWNPLAWAYRAVLVNEFTSSRYNSLHEATGQPEGEVMLALGGIVYHGEPFTRDWVWYTFVYLILHAVLCTILTGTLLKNVRAKPAKISAGVLSDELIQDEIEPFGGKDDIDIPFTPVTLSFDSICYDVKHPKDKGDIRLLNEVSGIFKAGRMTALMGSSGAGKTTLMDVIALRKTSGKITGDVRLNGFEQEPISFRRCSGYVEQFDVQAGALTVRETILYSARLRLEENDPATAGDEIRKKFVEHVIRTLELTQLADNIVGREGGGGLSFEQRKRLSIAVELAASPSIIFLDEPTSGLDSRAALLVVRTLRRIASSGRTVIATIHQPSSTVFEMFDDLLLLKKGGYAVFAGELGDESCNLVHYFENLGAKPIEHGQNPASWMLTVISDEGDTDYAAEFLSSEEFQKVKLDIEDANKNRKAEMQVKFDRAFAASRMTQKILTNQRYRTIYWRSPAHNLSRMVVSLVIAFLLGSIFITNRKPEMYSEQEITSLISTTFLSFIIVGVLTINSALPVMMEIRDLFYRHRAAGMVSDVPVAIALGTAERWFIVVSSALFCVIFFPVVGLSKLNFEDVGRGLAFWGFFTFNLALYSYFGQLFACSVRAMKTAQILASVYIGINNFFSGLIVRPQYLSGIFAFSYWINPGHYVYEGLIITLFWDNETPVNASPGSTFYEYLIAKDECTPANDASHECVGTVSDFVDDFFGGKFSGDHILVNTIVLGGILFMSRFLTFLALRYFNYTAT